MGSDRPSPVGRPLLIALVIALAATAFSSLPLAPVHARSWIGEIGGTGPDYTVFTTYDPGTPERGNYTVVVTNSGTEPWGAFHFKIFDPIGTLDISNVSFLDAAAGGEDPTSSQSGLLWKIDNGVVGATIDLFYCADPVVPGETAWFSVHISNPDHLSFFGVAFYPGPVPPNGACCSPDGSCALTCEVACVSPAIWHGDWTLCDPNPCPQPPPKGACCNPETGGCTFVVESECPLPYWIPGAACTPENPCAPPPVEAACCDLLGNCTLTLESECRPPSAWHPEWSSCDPVVCPQPTSVEGTTWGGIKAIYR